MVINATDALFAAAAGAFVARAVALCGVAVADRPHAGMLVSGDRLGR
jgi:hypothetical protein